MSVESSALGVGSSVPRGAVFLSYASQDKEAAKRICDALRAAGLEVWFDVSELRGGDSWDAKIRQQIKECALFVPIVSVTTNARPEGYFRLEWKLAVDRSHLLADDHPFLFPVALGDVAEATARVPDKFRDVQWTRLRLDETPAELAARITRLLGGEALKAGRPRPAERARGTAPPTKSKKDDHQAWLKHAWSIIGLAFAVYFLLFNPIMRRINPSERKPAKPEAATVDPSAENPAETAKPVASARKPAKTAGGALPADKSVAVLAFKNLSDEKDNEYFSDGISEELLTVLQKIPGLKVSARTSAFSFKGRDVTVQEVGKTLAVAYLVDGSVRKAGGKVRITARLSRTDTGQQLWSESYTRDVDDVFKLQTELAQTIVAQLQEQLTGGEDVDEDDVANQVTAAQKGGTTSVAAHELYLQGRYFANQPTTANLAKAVDFLQRAVDLDPSFALAWGALARNVALQAEYLETTPELLRESFARARRAADRAIALAPKLSDGYFARLEIQTAYDYDWAGARESLDTALALAPADALLISNASQLATQFGQVPRSLELGRRAVELDPVNAEIRYWLGRTYICAGLLAEGEAELRRAAELSPSLLSVHRQLSTAMVVQGRTAAAIEEARLEKDEWSRQAALSVACWAAKNVTAADAALARLIEVASESAAYQVAETYAFRAEIDKAFAWLDRAYRNRDSGFGQLRVDPLLRHLHPDPRWPALLQQAGLSDDRLKK